MSYIEVQDMAKKIGYETITEAYYKMPNEFAEVASDDEFDEAYLDFTEVGSAYGPTDELRSLPSSDDDENEDIVIQSIPNNQEFSPSRDLGIKELEIGMRFASTADFSLALGDFVIKEKMDIEFTRNDGDRVSAVCKQGCGWKIHASKPSNEQCLRIKRFSKEHKNCLWTHSRKQATSSYLANKYLEQVRLNPTMGNVALQSTIATKLDIDVSTYKMHTAKKRVLGIIEGDEAEQYAKLRDYCALIQRTNPGSRATIGVDPMSYDNEIKTFQRNFICYTAMKKGFRDGCTPFLGVDGCFLKGAYGGHLLSAVACDGNDQMFPVEFAVVEAETKDSWAWFMTELMEDVGPHFDITFM
ncbi:uncharacterized protein LOC132313911 [Cornus florida]|uniref:uncharacterized protein LOC132313911 n=1 Tax=Cornus florida TaxID=4283 RepID=UPI002899D1F4|nr:uncharacterized protein LOC132313911 [Cornus florida]